MPRMPRRDAPGALHHVTLRGVAQCDIFVDDIDRAFLLDRVAIVSAECGVALLAFAFMSNHVHALTRTGPIPLARFMSRVTTAYAMHFNRRHGRAGHLFQNRYNATPIMDDAHLRNAIRYIHANPLEAGIVPTLRELDLYPWAGHGILIGSRPSALLDVRSALAAFSDAAPSAGRSALREFMRGWNQPAASEQDEPLAPLRIPQLEGEIARVSAEFGIGPTEVTSGSRRRVACEARETIARVALQRGVRASEIALRLGVTHASILRAVKRSRLSG